MYTLSKRIDALESLEFTSAILMKKNLNTFPLLKQLKKPLQKMAGLQRKSVFMLSLTGEQF